MQSQPDKALSWRWLIAAVCFFCPSLPQPAQAHKPGESYVFFIVD